MGCELGFKETMICVYPGGGKLMSGWIVISTTFIVGKWERGFLFKIRRKINQSIIIVRKEMWITG